MTWDQVLQLNRDALVTIGAHTLHHYTLGHLEQEAARLEIAESKRIIESRLGRCVEHFSYPFGGRNAVGTREFGLARNCGFKSMTTTRAGNLFPAHRNHLDSLPRLTVSGNYQTFTNLRRLLSGLDAVRATPLKRVIVE
jgi:peptidoglycan/xylan/chitin deacetylase (PgdA/CDA1 family)